MPARTKSNAPTVVLARKCHPDVSKEADAEAKFKELGEAYEVLKSPEKRAAYNQLGAEWKSGQDFKPPPNWDEDFEFKGGGFTGGDAGDFSEFFEQLFGRAGFQTTHTGRQSGEHLRGQDSYAKIHIDLEESYRGATRTISLSTPEMNAQGQLQVKHRSLNVKIPQGVKPGQGNPGLGSGQSGDLFLEIAFNNHPLYRVSETDVYLDFPVTPWEMDINPLIVDENGALAADVHMAIYPLISNWQLADGTNVAIRPIRPEDAVLE
ncbi:MAG: DnaJ C-terminal domain-containing protein [Methyloglobulus sp.]